jgi:hypothetical protein
MSYFIFDMDETLAELYSVYYFIASLRLQETLSEHLRMNVDNKMRKSLEKAYDIFVEKVYEEEISLYPLGILRPGILGIMKHIHRLKINGVINGVVIYSNNSHLESLEFIRDLIYADLNLKTADNFISECVHYNHPMRLLEKTVLPAGAKSWSTLKEILINSKCGAPNSLEANEVFFFDDLAHPDLQYNLGTNYYKVPAYNFKASFDRLSDIFVSSLIEANVDLGIFGEYLIAVFMPTKQIFERDGFAKLNKIISVFKERTKGTVDTYMLSPKPDEGIQMMLDAIKRAGTSVVVGVAVGGNQKNRRLLSKRRKSRKRRVYIGGKKIENV